MSDLPDWVKPGASFHYVFQAGNVHHGRKFHVRGIVDGLAVMREWSKHKKRWTYTVEPPDYFEAYADHIIVDRPS